jgi:hydrogenase maturation protein HypF
MTLLRVLIKVRGTVQGVGFRPYVYGLASSLDLKGYVANTSEGVTIDIEGKEVESFIKRLQREAPPLSRITDIDISPLPPYGYQDFRIIESKDSGSFTLISPDVSICDDCLRELFDEGDRRYLYPFINCTNCGPRYTITKCVPYDRANTTMSVFRMCSECEAEYKNPADRRFHAEPNACSRCGPGIRLTGESSDFGDITDPMKKVRDLLREGAIVAIKGLGGFHLACDATSEEAVEKLRLRKRKSNKPFALMSPDIETIKKFCFVSPEEEALLLSNRRPIVLLRRKPSCALPEAIAPGNNRLGFMLPYTPLHYLLFREDSTGSHPAGLDRKKNRIPLVMTSGNLSEEPIQIDNEEVVLKLRGIADAFLTHDRDIFMRVDDSVLKVSDTGKVCFIRRARGYTPEPVMLAEEGADVLATGADIKNTFTLMKGSFAIVSQHIGDMENYETLKFFEETLENLKAVYRVEPEAIAYDLHPGYLSTQWALRQAGRKLPVQHHHAHIASVMAEKGIKEKVIGVAFDGTGYGADGTLWGGEFLISTAIDFKRAGHLRYVPLPGGEMAIKEPWRTAVSYVKTAVGAETEDYLERIGFIEKYGRERIRDILKIINARELSPVSSGAGRLFDAVSAILGVCDKNTFEGEAAVALEAVAAPGVEDDYPLNIEFKEPMEVDFSFAIISIINDLTKGVDKGIIAAKFHNTVVEAIVRVVRKLAMLSRIADIVLSGGVFQNDYLLVRVEERLKEEGFSVYTNEVVPLNDGGISLGQAYILRESLKAGVEI